MAGAKTAKGSIVVVMDADLSHPPEAIPKLVEPIAADTHDMVIGSRYISGGATQGWPLARLICSRIATLLAWPFTDVRDPMSGFFSIRRNFVADIEKKVTGFKIGLEMRYVLD